MSKNPVLLENQVYLNLYKPYFAAYLKHIFSFQEESGLSIERTHKIGKYIYAFVMRREFPVNPTPSKNSILLKLPVGQNLEHYENKFLYIDKYCERQINDFIDSYFHFHFYEFCIFNQAKFKLRQDLILAFRKSVGMTDEHISLENLLKSDQRFRKKAGIIA